VDYQSLTDNDRELTDDELELVIGGQSREQFELWRINLINEGCAEFRKKSQITIETKYQGE